MSNNRSDEEKLRQWLAALNKLQEQINDLKIGLSQVLSKEFSAELLVRIESFQSHLLDHDAAIAVLRHELSTQISRMKTGPAESARSSQADPAKDIKAMGKEIGKLKVQLAKYTAAFGQAAD